MPEGPGTKRGVLEELSSSKSTAEDRKGKISIFTTAAE